MGTLGGKGLKKLQLLVHFSSEKFIVKKNHCFVKGKIKVFIKIAGIGLMLLFIPWEMNVKKECKAFLEGLNLLQRAIKIII